MIRLLILAFLLGAGSVLRADPVPALYDVTGVAFNDVLNMRAEPSGSSEKLGELAHDATGVEVVDLTLDGTWGRVNAGEGSGWVAMRYLARRPDHPTLWMTPRLACFGTEPFWSLTIDQGDSARFEPLADQPRTVPAGTLQPGVGVINRFMIALGDNLAVIRQEQCHDGMSDRAFGLDISLVLDGTLYSGCCSLVAD
ncbi:COG3650 family protein [Ruegeria marina]|uniref:SH3 domain-containing protein n=1 Tax=Ruegeria marina TaxID=639004 RepID=A0A1G6WK03_9RHOB|nr:SH3 domain-containing protein [Ruegeria marina]SDD66134.1 SH3 domain-containing protein [Ruegeria marina]